MARLIDSLVGHRNVLEPLLTAASKQRLSSSLIFSGPAGIGKKLAADVLAQALLCERASEQTGGARTDACGQCGPCLRVERGQSESILLIGPDGQNIKIEQAREILQFLVLRKLGRARLVIIDQAHLLNPQAANALLKAIEEPPSGTYFILLTALASSLLPTIRSRAQLVRFHELSSAEIQAVCGGLDEGMLESARGSVGRALRLKENQGELQELETQLERFLRVSSESFPGAEVTDLKELLKERSAQSDLGSILQMLFRDELRVRGGARATGALWAKLREPLARVSSAQLSDFCDFALELEGDLQRNFDRSLLLENFALSWRRASQTAAGSQ